MESITFEKLSKSFVNAFLRFVLSFLYFLTWKHYYFDNYENECHLPVPTGSSVSLRFPLNQRGERPVKRSSAGNKESGETTSFPLSHWDRISEGYQAAHLNEGWSQQEPAEQSYYYQRLSCAALTLL